MQSGDVVSECVFIDEELGTVGAEVVVGGCGGHLCVVVVLAWNGVSGIWESTDGGEKRGEGFMPQEWWFVGYNG